MTSQIVLVSFCEFFFSLSSLSHIDRAQDEKHSEEVSHFQEELADAHAQLQILQKQLDDELNKQPLTNQEVQCGFVVKSSQLPRCLKLFTEPLAIYACYALKCCLSRQVATFQSLGEN